MEPKPKLGPQSSTHKLRNRLIALCQKRKSPEKLKRKTPAPASATRRATAEVRAARLRAVAKAMRPTTRTTRTTTQKKTRKEKTMMTKMNIMTTKMKRWMYMTKVMTLLWMMKGMKMLMRAV